MGGRIARVAVAMLDQNECAFAEVSLGDAGLGDDVCLPCRWSGSDEGFVYEQCSWLRMCRSAKAKGR